MLELHWQNQYLPQAVLQAMIYYHYSTIQDDYQSVLVVLPLILLQLLQQ